MLCIICNLNEIARKSKKYCSRDCMAIAYKKPRNNCLVCGKETSEVEYRFCSRSCSAKYYNKDRQIFRSCAVCNKPHKNKMFCSYTCSVSIKKLPDDERLRRKRLKTLIAVRRYQARRLNQMPLDADHEKIKAIYANCPKEYEVDHIIPISRGGLHHQDNLQYLLKMDNRKKSDKLDYTPMAERLGT